MFLRIFFLGRSRLRRWWLALSAMFMISMVLAWFAPAIVSSRMLWPRVMAHLAADFDATVTAGAVNLRWLGPVVLHDVRVADLSGEPVAQVETIRTDQTLLSLLFSSRDFGKILVEQPQLQLQLRPNGSNLEDILETYLSRRESSATTTGVIEIKDGLVIVDATHDYGTAPARFEKIDATITLKGGTEGSLDIRSCRAASAKSEGSLEAAMAWQSAGNSTTWSAAAKIKSLDLSLLQGGLERLDLSIDVAGIGDLDAMVSCEDIAQGVTIELQQASVRQLQLSAPDYLGEDTLAFQEAVARGTCRVAKNHWRTTGVEFQCDAGHVVVDGEFAWPDTEAPGVLQQMLAVARSADMRMTGHVDLAQLAATLPRTLRIREGSIIESGTMDFSIQGAQETDVRSWTANLKTSELAARRDGQQFTWNAPLRVTIDGSQTGTTWHVERLVCTSSFLSLTGQGTPSAGSFSLQCDLQQLSNQFKEFVDLGPLDATGTMKAQLDWKQGADQRIAIHGTSLLENLNFDSGVTGRWQEPRLSLTVAAEGEWSEHDGARIRTAQLQATSSTDRLTLDLLEPVESPGSSTLWVIGCEANGQSSTWFRRLRPLLPASLPTHAWTVAGPIDMQMNLRVGQQRVAVEQGKIRSGAFLLDSPQIRIDEPEVAVKLEGRWEFDTHRLRIPEATFQSQALAFRIIDLRIDPDGSDVRTTGDVTFHADLQRLHKTWRVPAKQHDWKFAGSAEGQVSLVQAGNNTRARWTIDFADLKLDRRQLSAPTRNVIPAANATKWFTVWREPILTAQGSGQCDLAAETIVLERFDLGSADKLQLSLQGSLTQPIGPCTVDIQGQVTYDLAKLLQHWAPELASHVQWTGHDTQSFLLRGPLFHVPSNHARSLGHAQSDSPTAGMIPPTLHGESGFSWQSADLFGISVGAGVVGARLDAGTIETGVIDLPVSGGTMRVKPTVHLNHHPPVVTIAPGQILRDVQITKGMCDQWLKYVAPVAADATRAEGIFSMSSVRTTIPLRNPTATDAEGTLDIHQASIGPGPLAQELIMAAEAAKRLLQLNLGDVAALGQNDWVHLPQQQTRFWVANKRVHHERLALQVGEVMIYTRGSVGFDQTVSLIAQIFIQDQWIAGQPHLQALRGQVVQIPVSGTLSNPRIDQRALQQLSRDALKQAAGQAVQDELQRGLQRWLGTGR